MNIQCFDKWKIQAINLNETISNHHMYPKIRIDIQEIISIENNLLTSNLNQVCVCVCVQTNILNV
jgi:hypothetical protein